jgi:hypothetical protein
MWFMLRVTFWLGLVIFLLPPDPSPTTASAPPVDATGSVSTARDADTSAATPSHGTLTPADLAEPWRGPRKEKGRPA